MALGVSRDGLPMEMRAPSHFDSAGPPPVPMDPPTLTLGSASHRAPTLQWASDASARISRSLSIRGVAKAAGISAQSLLLTEAGETVPLVSTCEALAVALDVSPVWLAYGYGVGVEEGRSQRRKRRAMGISTRSKGRCGGCRRAGLRAR